MINFFFVLFPMEAVSSFLRTFIVALHSLKLLGTWVGENSVCKVFVDKSLNKISIQVFLGRWI